MKIKYFIIAIILLLAAFSLFCFLYPFVSNFINEYFNESMINEYNQNTNTISSNEINRLFSKAEEYNRLLATDFYDKSDDPDDSYQRIINSYFEILNIDNGIMGYIEIPSIHVRLPIYHGESEDVLTKGAAHIEQTSFPVGGNSTHACISAHSGFPSQKFFDDIDELKEGDVIFVKILNRTLHYKVYFNEVVEPDNAGKLRIIQGEDILTLVTCYPYGINSHRLLVHARRTVAEESAASPEETTKPTVITESTTSDTEGLIIGSVIAATGTLTVLGIVLLKRRKTRRDKNMEFIQFER